MTGSEGVNFCTVRIDDKKCDYCMECVNTCPTSALTYDSSVKVFMHNAYECSYCETCMDVCDQDAIKILDM
jgi:ferredoxin